MPNALLSVPHFEQSRDGFCLPACIQMVLAYWGRSITEAELAKQLQTTSLGTPIRHVERLRRYGYRVEFGSSTVQQMKEHLTAGRPVITRLWTEMLDYWDTVTSHVVVVTGFDEHYVYLNDPGWATFPMAVLWDGFLAAWAEFDETSAIIYP